MIVSCENCATRYSVADDALGSDGRKVKCISCGHVWLHPGIGTEQPAESVATDLEVTAGGAAAMTLPSRRQACRRVRDHRSDSGRRRPERRDLCRPFGDRPVLASGSAAVRGVRHRPGRARPRRHPGGSVRGWNTGASPRRSAPTRSAIRSGCAGKFTIPLTWRARFRRCASVSPTAPARRWTAGPSHSTCSGSDPANPPVFETSRRAVAESGHKVVLGGRWAVDGDCDGRVRTDALAGRYTAALRSADAVGRTADAARRGSAARAADRTRWECRPPRCSCRRSSASGARAGPARR